MPYLEDIDSFSSNLLEEAKRFLERAKDTSDEVAEAAYLHAALLIAFSALEAQVNSVSDDMSLASGLHAHELSILNEKEVRLEDGSFVVNNSLKIYRLEDRLMFLFSRFSRNGYLKGNDWMAHLRSATKLRNDLTHPKGIPVITIVAVETAIIAIIDTLSALYKAVYKTDFPGSGKGINSKLDF